MTQRWNKVNNVDLIPITQEFMISPGLAGQQDSSVTVAVQWDLSH